MRGKIECHCCGKEFEIDETEYQQKKELYDNFICDKCVEEHTCAQCGKVTDKLFEDKSQMNYVCAECRETNRINRWESLFS